jgi:hypothetical protein
VPVQRSTAAGAATAIAERTDAGSGGASATGRIAEGQGGAEAVGAEVATAVAVDVAGCALSLAGSAVQGRVASQAGAAASTSAAAAATAAAAEASAAGALLTADRAATRVRAVAIVVPLGAAALDAAIGSVARGAAGAGGRIADASAPDAELARTAGDDTPAIDGTVAQLVAAAGLARGAE